MPDGNHRQLREEAEQVQAALGEAERAVQRLLDARATVSEVAAEPSSAVVEDGSGRDGGIAGATFPHGLYATG
ncbi:hypothetical protein AB0A77_36995 [Streptomyces varsoviensis]|uniref:hypothetical protein n=1 Tax=Streptomyces varsoviensis TaxID=67373 RepID=UPI0033FA2163